MAAPAPPAEGRRRARRGSLERPVNGRMYRGTWLLVGVPLLAVAFSVSRAESLPAPALPPTFDAETARILAEDLALDHPNRTPGSVGPVNWIRSQFGLLGFEPKLRTFKADIPGLGPTQLTNVVAVAPGRSRQAIVVLAHRDNLGTGPGTNDNASGTAAMLELARTFAFTEQEQSAGGRVIPAHDVVFLSTDGGAYGAVGAARFAADPAYRGRVEAVIVLDAVAGTGAARIEIAGDEPRSPDAVLVQTAAMRMLEQTGVEPERPRALGQLVDLGFPFSLYEQAPFVAAGIPAVTLTTQDEPVSASSGDADQLDVERLGQLGRAAQQLLASLDAGLDVSPASGAFVYLGPRLVRGWAVQLALVAALLPFLAAAVDLFARCRRRRIALAPALRSYRSRIGFWLGLGGIAWLLGLLGAWPEGVPRPIQPQSAIVDGWPWVPLGLLAGAAVPLWLSVRERLLPRRQVTSEEELAGQTAALLALGMIALVTLALNPYALLFLLPSAHAWIWLPQLRERHTVVRLAVFAAGLAGPGLLVVAFALRLGLGLDAPWYLAAIAAVGYVDVAPLLLFLAWAAVAAQLAALSTGRYAPYPGAGERPRQRAVARIARRLSERRAAEDEARAVEGP